MSQEAAQPFGAAGSGPLPGQAGIGGVPVRSLLETIGYGLIWLFIFFVCFTFLRPSPYDFIAIPAMLLWFALGIRLHRSSIFFVALLLIYQLSLVLALLPYLDEADPVAWTFQSFYLMITAIFFVMFFSDQAEKRAELVLKAYLASCLFAAVAAIISYFALPGSQILFTTDGRASGVFEDPNVLGSFLILGVVYLLRRLLTGEGRHPIVSLCMLLVLLTGVFLSFSRGSWGASVVALTLTTGMTFITSKGRIRRRIVLFSALTAIGGTLLLGSLLTVPQIQERFTDRAQLTKDYDQGVTGRFGNQLRSIPMLIERPGGFGPLRFRLTFELEPHNSYIGGFANGGWLGGLSFIGIVLATSFVGFRLCFVPSPFRGLAQVVWPTLFVFFLQAFQIDIDHWRHVFLMLGMIWGLEAARLAWASRMADLDARSSGHR